MVSKHWLRAAGFAALAASAVVRNLAPPPRTTPRTTLRGQNVVALDAYRKVPMDRSWPSLIGDLLARVDEE